MPFVCSLCGTQSTCVDTTHRPCKAVIHGLCHLCYAKCVPWAPLKTKYGEAWAKSVLYGESDDEDGDFVSDMDRECVHIIAFS